MSIETQRDKVGRRTWDHVYYWLPIILSLAIGGIGHWMESDRTIIHTQDEIRESELRIQGEMKLIEYRLEQVEKKDAR